MAKYRVQTPGGVVVIEGPPDAPQEQIIRLAQQQYETLAKPGGREMSQLESGLGGKATGAGEAALTTLTGSTSGLLGLISGTLKGIANELASGEFGSYGAADRIEQSAMKGAQALTYEPRTEKGKEYIQAVSEVTEPLAALTPMLPEFGMTAQSMRQAAPIVRASADKRVMQPIKQATQPVLQRVQQTAKQLVPTTEKKPTPGTGASGGAMAVDKAVQRQMAAEGLPVPIKLIEGQKTRSFEQQRFERETAKDPEFGAPLRERFRQQNEQLIQNMDEFIDMTGAEITDLRGVGEIVDKALRNRAARDKIKIRSLYKKADTAGEMSDPVDLNGVSKWLNENRASRVEEGLMAKVQRKLEAMEVAEGDFKNGTLKIGGMNLKQSESVRKFINDNVDSTDAREIRIASILKSEIDNATEGLGGNFYKQARRARQKYAQDYENIGLVKNLLGLKRGTEDRAVALEDVLRKSVLEPSASLDSVRQIRRLLQTAGDDGKQAWKELQGGTLRHIQEQMTKGVGRDEAGNPIVSPAALDREISKLDRSGKLDFIFGKKGAEQLRTINEVAKDVLTSPPGAVNTSNTATVLAGLMDVALTGATGVPAPVASSARYLLSQIKDAKLKARVKKTLGE